MRSIARRALASASRASPRAATPPGPRAIAPPAAWAPAASRASAPPPPCSAAPHRPPPLARSYFAGHPQIRNAEGQDMAQVRAGVRLRKALCAVMSHPSMAHRFEPVGVVILEVRMARDFKLAHVRYVVANDAPDDALDDSDDSRRLHLRRKAAAILRANAARLRNMAGKMLRAKHTPRLEFVDDDEVTREERALNAAFERVEEEEKARKARRREEEEEEAAGGYEPALLADDGEAGEPNRREEEEEAEEEATAMGYAFETYDGGPNYRSDFDPAFDERVDRLLVADDDDAAEEGLGILTAPSSPGVAGRRGARRARALAAGGLLLDETGDEGDEGEEEGLDDAAWAAFLEEDDGLEEEEEKDDDDDAFDEFVDGDEFDEFEEEEEEEEEEDDFDFEKFDRVEERRRERGGGR